MSDLFMTRGARYAVVVLFVLVLAIGGANLLFTAHEVNRVQTAVEAQCKFDGDIAGAPVTPPTGGKPSRLGVTIVADSRTAWRGLGCPGKLPPAAPSFVKWARFYHLPAS